MFMISKEIVIKKSRFIAYIFDLKSEEEIKKYLNKMKISHKKAKHICYAYNFNYKEKASDDNEPKGTASLPLISMIRYKKLNNILVVVVRYFGGIKLGSGGLTRAYNKAAGNIIDLYLKEKDIL